MEILMKMFYGGMFVGALIGMAIMCVIALIVLEIIERRADD